MRHMYNNWMANISDDTVVSTLSLPGTHNSGAYFKIAAPSVRCQGRSIYQQLTNGVRFLDFRLSKDYMSRGENVDDLIIVHGKFPVNLSGSSKFKHALHDVYKFLDENPTETVLISVKFENTMLNWNHKTDEFSKVLFEKYIGRNRDKWYLSDKIPAIKYARGKAILLRRFPILPDGVYKKFGIPCHWDVLHSNQLRSTSNFPVCAQDYSDIKSTADLSKKVDMIKDMIHTATDYHQKQRKNSNSSTSSNETNYSANSMVDSLSTKCSSIELTENPKLFINFCTGANYMKKNLWPSNVDKAIRRFNIDKHFTKNCGILILDFADREEWKLVKRLVDVNLE